MIYHTFRGVDFDNPKICKASACKIFLKNVIDFCRVKLLSFGIALKNIKLVSNAKFFIHYPFHSLIIYDLRSV